MADRDERNDTTSTDRDLRQRRRYRRAPIIIDEPIVVLMTRKQNEEFWKLIRSLQEWIRDSHKR